MKELVLILVLCFVFGETKAQESDTSKVKMGFIIEGDSIVYKTIDDIIVLPSRKFKNKRQQRRYTRYIRKIKKVYPLAVKAQKLLVKYEPQYNAMEEKRDKRRLMKQLEKELLAEHMDKLKKWSISDGRMLLKLINRETERIPYNLIKDFRGGVSALFWQGIARIFSNNLKAEYDPEEDWMLEEIVILIEKGYL